MALTTAQFNEALDMINSSPENRKRVIEHLQSYDAPARQEEKPAAADKYSWVKMPGNQTDIFTNPAKDKPANFLTSNLSPGEQMFAKSLTLPGQRK